MLRLEKISRRGDIKISLRARERILNKIFLQSLSLAVAWHLLIFFLFSINDLKILEDGNLLPRATVEALFTPEIEENIFAEESVENEDKKISFLFSSLSEPELPEVQPLVNFPLLHFSLLKEEHLHNPFEDIEKNLQEDYFFNEESLNTYSPTLQIHVSGPLSLRLIAPQNEIKDVNMLPYESQNWIFDIKVLDAEGSIFWFQSHTFLDKEKMQIAKKILENLRFQSFKSGFISSGQVEIVLNKGKK